MRGPRALIIVGLSIALLATAASSASALTISPTSADFGRLLIGKSSAPVTFTVTKGSVNEPANTIHSTGDFFTESYTCVCFPSSTACPNTLTDKTPSCTITVFFQPDRPGPQEGAVLPNHIPTRLTGIGLIPAKSLVCRKKGGRFISRKKITRYCVNR
jgi:hypothetical protein